MATFNNILDIPGLVPVDLHSSNPYPISPFAPKIKPPETTLAPISTVSAPQGSGPALDTSNISGGGGQLDPYSGSIGASGDPFFLGLGGGGGLPDFSAYYGNDVNPAQLGGLSNALPNIGTGLSNYGSGIWDNLSSIGNEPYFTGDNALQTGINAASMFVPGIGPLAGILQGFNLLNPGETTGNPLVDAAATPGTMQNIFADAANWLNRQFGGDYMPSSYIDPNMYGPPTPDGSPYGGTGQYVAPPVIGPTPDGSPYSPVPTPTPRPDEGRPGFDIYGFPIGSADSIAIGGSSGYSGDSSSPAYWGMGFSPTGLSTFDSLGLSRMGTGDMGGAFGYANFGGPTGGFDPFANNGGWGQ